MKKILLAAILVFTMGLIKANDASAWGWHPHVPHWVNNTVNTIKHDTTVAAHAVATGATTAANAVATGAKAVGKFAKENAKKACEKAVPAILKKGIGKACKTVAAEFGAECNAALDIETEGMAAPACTGGAIAISYECKHYGGKFASPMISTATNEICSKI